MSRNYYKNWLTTLNYPRSGVGDLRDLKFSAGVGDNGRWLGFVNTGWYYYDNKEQYHYIIKGSATVTGAVGSGTINNSISFRPSWGPVLIDGENYQYTELHECFSPGNTLSWSIAAFGDGIYQATIPTGAILVGMLNDTNLPMGGVAGSADLFSESLFWYDYVNRTVYIKPDNPSDIKAWANILYSTPRLRVREQVIETDAGVKASYRLIENYSVIRGSQTFSSSGQASGWITHTLSGLSNGDWVILEYNVPYSYIVEDHDTVKYYTSNTVTGDVMAVSWETSIPYVIPPISLTKALSGQLQLNPIFSDSHRAGYVFHSTTASAASSLWVPTKLQIDLNRTEVCAEWGQSVKATILLLDSAGLPVPWHKVTVSLTAGSTALFYAPSASSVDGRGEMHLMAVPGTGLSTITVGVSAQTVSGLLTTSASAIVRTAAQTMPLSSFMAGAIHMHIDNEITSRRFLRSYINSTFLDGIPRADTITLSTRKATEIEVDGTVYGQTATINTLQSESNVCAIKEVGILPQKNEELVAYNSQSGQSIIKELEDSL